MKHRIYAFSDTHGFLEGLDPSSVGADICVIAGDVSPCLLTVNPNKYILNKFYGFVRKHENVTFVMTPGNHDFVFMGDRGSKMIKAAPKNLHVLVDSGFECDGIRFYGTPWVPYINGCWAFECPVRDDDLLFQKHFCEIPYGVDILISHSPPRVAGSQIDVSTQDGIRGPFGSKALMTSIAINKPNLTICGHIHSGDHIYQSIDDDGEVVPPGSIRPFWKCATTAFNVSRIDENYRIRYKPLVIDYDPDNRSFILVDGEGLGQQSTEDGII